MQYRGMGGGRGERVGVCRAPRDIARARPAAFGEIEYKFKNNDFGYSLLHGHAHRHTCETSLRSSGSGGRGGRPLARSRRRRLRRARPSGLPRRDAQHLRRLAALERLAQFEASERALDVRQLRHVAVAVAPLPVAAEGRRRRPPARGRWRASFPLPPPPPLAPARGGKRLRGSGVGVPIREAGGAGGCGAAPTAAAPAAPRPRMEAAESGTGVTRDRLAGEAPTWSMPSTRPSRPSVLSNVGGDAKGRRRRRHRGGAPPRHGDGAVPPGRARLPESVKLS